MEKKKFKIDEKKTEGDLLYLSISPIDGKNILFSPGQFVKLISSNKQEEPKSRFYSIISSPLDSHLQFIIKIVGRFTNHLNSLEKGDMIEAEGPYGHFIFKKEKKAVFIAGGVGIAPVLSILREISQKKTNGDFFLFYSNKSKEIPFFDELKKISEKSTNIKIIFTLTKEQPAHWEGESGRIDINLISKYIPVEKLNEFYFYMCGPLNMTLSLKKDLTLKGVLENNIIIEGWG